VTGDRTGRPSISVVVPVFQAESCLRELAGRLAASLGPLAPDFEVVLVDDGSPDGSWETIEGLAASDPRFRGVKLSRNFGQHAAITAGLDRAAGSWTVLMDCDLQDRPEEIPRLYDRARQGYDVVFALRKRRSDSWWRRASSRAFYRVLGYLTDTKQDPEIGNFGIYSAKAIGAVTGLRESLRYFPAMIRWVGFRTSAVEVEHASPAGRRSAYSPRKLANLALGVMISFSEKPLRIAVKLGLAISGLSFVAAVALILRAVLVRQAVPGWSSLMASVWFLSGPVIFFLGLSGLYLGKVFEEVKRRPLYIVEKTAEPGSPRDAA